jgi:hypothetical protein
MSNVNYEVLQKRLFDRLHRTGEEIKNDFPNILRACVESKAWEQFTRPDGKPFKSLGDWLVYSFPNGCSMGQSENSISYEDALQLCKGERNKDLHAMLVKHRPSKTGGRRGRPTKEQGKSLQSNDLPEQKLGNSRAYIEQRLQRDHPDVFKEYVSGAIKSARQAGIKAGFIKDTHDPLMRLKAYWKKADSEQRAAFKAWLRTKEAK